MKQEIITYISKGRDSNCEVRQGSEYQTSVFPHHNHAWTNYLKIF